MAARCFATFATYAFYIAACGFKRADAMRIALKQLFDSNISSGAALETHGVYRHAALQHDAATVDATGALQRMLPSVRLALLLGLGVGVAMFLGAVLVFVVLQRRSKAAFASAQYFSSGILLAVIGQELLPSLEKAADGITGSIAICVGFSAGVALLYGVEHWFGEAEAPSAPSDTDKAQAGGVQHFQHPRSRSSLIVKPHGDLDSEAGSTRKVPWALALPIYIDAVMDGLLIGMMSAMSEHGAVILALATAVEMGFLGVTFGALVMRCGPMKWVLAGLCPVLLASSAAAGAASANVVPSTLEAGITAFCIAALLFLACNELLKEAIEDGSNIRQSCCLFIGFLTIIMLERILPSDS